MIFSPAESSGEMHAAFTSQQGSPKILLIKKFFDELS